MRKYKGEVNRLVLQRMKDICDAHNVRLQEMLSIHKKRPGEEYIFQTDTVLDMMVNPMCCLDGVASSDNPEKTKSVFQDALIDKIEEFSIMYIKWGEDFLSAEVADSIIATGQYPTKEKMKLLEAIAEDKRRKNIVPKAQEMHQKVEITVEKVAGEIMEFVEDLYEVGRPAIVSKDDASFEKIQEIFDYQLSIIQGNLKGTVKLTGGKGTSQDFAFFVSSYNNKGVEKLLDTDIELGWMGEGVYIENFSGNVLEMLMSIHSDIVKEMRNKGLDFISEIEYNRQNEVLLNLLQG